MPETDNPLEASKLAAEIAKQVITLASAGVLANAAFFKVRLGNSSTVDLSVAWMDCFIASTILMFVAMVISFMILTSIYQRGGATPHSWDASQLNCKFNWLGFVSIAGILAFVVGIIA